MRKLNLGCGLDIRKSTSSEKWVNIDHLKLPGVDKVHNLDRYPWPFKNDEFDYIYCHHVLEHLDSILKPMEEIWRITRNKAKIEIELPITPSVEAFLDPTHKQFYTFLTFDY